MYIDALVATSFINEVDMSTLGRLVPILTKRMREKKVAVKRRAALVIGNMCKLQANTYPVFSSNAYVNLGSDQSVVGQYNVSSTLTEEQCAAECKDSNKCDPLG